jgi:phosphatidylglycerol---prolipoprotein diacylglyceryl transferase
MVNNVFYININPVIFQLGPVTVSWYGLMIALAAVTVVWWAFRQNSRRHQFSHNTLIIAAAVGLVSGVVFSKLLHVIDQFSYYQLNPSRILSAEGLAIWGAVLGATLGIWGYSLVSRQFRFSMMGDMLAPGIILAQAIGRVGCTINGCCYGIESHSPLAVIYTKTPYAPVGIPTLPVVGFEIVFNLVVFGILLWLRGKLKPEGSLFLVYLALYASWRTGIDFLREGSPFLFGLHQAQVISIIVILISVPLLIFRLRREKVYGT